MSRTIVIVCVLVMGLSSGVGAASNSGDNQKTDDGRGITLDDLGRGLKSGAQNIEKEIPKIGPAIVETFKKLTGKDSEKQSPHTSEREKK